MLYRELVQFEPLDTIIQLREADDKAIARQRVESYVFSERMTEQLSALVIPNLRLDRPTDAKGLFIVGNYGTGKSHLMSVISAIAEHADLLPQVRSPELRERFAPVAGKFKVVRMELGGVLRRLRDGILEALEIFLDEVGAPYTFPSVNDVSNNKDSLLEAIAGFRAVYPDHSILFVLDELLDFLKSQDERSLLLDLGFFRELGEVVELAPFRFIAGVQESLFDSPSFAFVAGQLRRVRERFEQIRIAREDIAYVVAERLLRKSDAQLALISEHLRRFTPLYPAMANRLDEYVRLFPIHPAYIETLEQVYIVEKREVLKTFETAILQVLDKIVPTDQTGLISYDHYWLRIKDNPSLRAQDGVAQVVTKSDVLSGRIESAYTRPNLLPMARRIIDALSVLRLTTSDVNAPLGVTVEELRDKLCLWTAIPEADAQFLADTIQTALREILRTVNGQYISFNEGNGQYYLDLKKDIDFETNIRNRGDFFSRTDLNKYFFDALQELFGFSTGVYVPNYLIWFYELPWAQKNVTRPGYFFFLEPNERSTAQPPRDFYLYFLPPFRSEGQAAATSDREDEVLFALTAIDEEFEQIVRRYAGARAMAGEAPAHAQTYGDRADELRRTLRRWLEQNLTNKLRITARAVTRTAPEIFAEMRSTASTNLAQMVSNIAAHLLRPHFQDAYPEYPAFAGLREPVTESNRGPSAMDAIRRIATRSRTNLATAVLNGLRLLDEQGENVLTRNSPYAQHFLTVLQEKPETQVVNQGEVIEQVAGGLQPIYKDLRYHLEPEWVAVILTALVYDGQIELTPGSNQAALDAAGVERAATIAIQDLANFRFYKRPRGLPLAVWQQIFDGLGLQSALVRDENSRAEAVRELLIKVRSEAELLAQWQGRVQQSLTLWNESLFTDGLTLQSQGGMVVGHSDLAATRLSVTDLVPALRGAKSFLDTLTRYDTPGKMRNLPLSAVDVQEALNQRTAALRLRSVLDAIDQLQSLATYLVEAQANLTDDPWLAEAAQMKSQLLDALRQLAHGRAAFAVTEWKGRLEALKQSYIRRYADLHEQARLSQPEDQRRAALLRSPRAVQFKELAKIDLFSRQQEYPSWQRALTGLPACLDFHTGLLADTPTCPRCRFRASDRDGVAAAQLGNLDTRLDTLLQQWHAGLRDALDSEVARSSLAAMTPVERRPLEQYLAQSDPLAGAVNDDMVNAANRALRGLETVALASETLLAALRQGGLPCTVAEIQARIGRYLGQVMRGHDVNNTRLTLE